MATTQYQIFIRYLNETVNKPLTNMSEVEWVSALDWIDMQEYYALYKSEFNTINAAILNGTKKLSDLSTHEIQVYEKCGRYTELKKHVELDDGMVVLENIFIRGYDGGYHPGQGTLGACKNQLGKITNKMTDVTTEGVLPDNPKYDMLFMYTGVGTASFPGWHLGQEQNYPKYYPWESKNDTVMIHMPQEYNGDLFVPEVYMERMKRTSLDPWFFHSQHASLKSAMTKAEELVNILGKNGVKIGKVVALDQYIDIV